MAMYRVRFGVDQNNQEYHVDASSEADAIAKFKKTIAYEGGARTIYKVERM
ncbi:MAG: hypothetical protein J1E16_00470 [Muribaculaceae bacterium]|nr:hypothetical protein [Muribaculaceae bacterium]